MILKQIERQHELDLAIDQKKQQLVKIEQDITMTAETLKDKCSEAEIKQKEFIDHINRLVEERTKTEQEMRRKQHDLEQIILSKEDECLDKLADMGLAAKCGICFCLIKNNCVLLPCAHSSFCEECILPMFNKDKVTCPLCRSNVTEYKRLFNA
jgi:hypothetical protein